MIPNRLFVANFVCNYFFNLDIFVNNGARISCLNFEGRLVTPCSRGTLGVVEKGENVKNKC